MGYYTPTYTVQDVASEVKRIFGDEAGVQLNDTDIIRWINRGQLEIFKTADILKATSTADIVAGQYMYSITGLPILKIQGIYYNGVPLNYVSFQEYSIYVAKTDPLSSASGTPTMWTEWAGSLHLYPKPDTAYVAGLAIYYSSAPVKVTALSDILGITDSYYSALIDYVLSKAYELDEDPQNSQFKLGQFSKGVSDTSGDEVPQISYFPMITVLPEDE